MSHSLSNIVFIITFCTVEVDNNDDVSLVKHTLPPETSRIYLNPPPFWLGTSFIDGPLVSLASDFHVKTQARILDQKNRKNTKITI